MKKYIFFIVLICLSIFGFSQTNKNISSQIKHNIDPIKKITKDEYDKLKSRGLINGNETVIRSDKKKSAAVNIALKPALTNNVAVITPCDFPPTTGNNGFPTPASGSVNDDETNSFTLPFSFCFYGASYTSMNVFDNGNVQFSTNSTAFTSTGFPSTTVNMIAPFWADGTADVIKNGLRYGKCKVDNFSSTTHVIVSWDSLPYYQGSSPSSFTDLSLLNSFQLVITDGTDPILPPGKNVGFYYKNMMWTTGNASSGTSGFPTSQPGNPATVGANEGNGVDFFQIGRFGLPGSIFDGPNGNSDGVSWLNGKKFFFNLCPPAGSNLEPFSTLIGYCDTYTVCGNDNLTINNIYNSGEQSNQTVSVSVSAPSLAGSFTYSTSAVGNVTSISMNVDGSTATNGAHVVTISATDNGVPAMSNVLTFTVYVDHTATNALSGNIVITPTVGVCPGAVATASLNLTGTPSTILWNNNSTATSTSFTVTPSLDSLVFVTVTSGQCQKTIKNYIHVSPVPTASITGNTSLCSGTNSTTVLSATNTTHTPDQSPYTYTWSGSTTPVPFNTQNTTVSGGTYSVIIKNKYNCQSTATTTVVLNQSPVFTVVPTNTTVCQGSVPLSINFGSGTTSSCGLASTPCSSSNTFQVGVGTSNGSSSNYTPYNGTWESGHHQYLYKAAELTAAGITAGKLSSLAFNITSLNSGNTSYANFAIKVKCTTANVLTTTMDVSGFSQVYSSASINVATGWNQYNFSQPYTWDGTSNILVDICYYDINWNGNNSVQYSTMSYNAVSYNTSSSNICGTSSASGTSTNRPNIRFGYCSAVPNPNDYSYSWSPATGLSSTSVYNPTATVNNSITYSVIVTPTAATTCTRVGTTSLTVTTPQQPTITAVTSTCTSAPAFSLTATPSGGSWSVTATTNSLGVFTPSLVTTSNNIVTYSYGTIGCAYTATTNVYIEKYVPSNITSSISPQCVGNPIINLFSPTLTQYTTGVWSGNGIISGSSFDPAAAGTGTTVLTYSTNSSPMGLCPSTNTLAVSVFSLSQPAITSAGPYCDNFPPQTMTVSSTGGTWSAISPGTSINSVGVFTPSISLIGTNTILYTIVNGPCIKTQSLSIDVQAFTPATILGTITPQCVYNNTVDLAPPFTMFGSGVWSGPGITGSVFSPTLAGVNTHTLIYTLNQGGLCEDDDSLVVIVNRTPTPNILITDISGCNYPFVTDFRETTEVNGIAEWDFGNGVTLTGPLTVQNTYTNAGMYRVSITYTDNATGCVGTYTAAQTVTVFPVPEANFESPDNLSVVDADVKYTNLTPNPNNDITFLWNIADLQISTQTDANYLFTNSGVYTTTLIATNSNGCQDTMIRAITINPDVVLYVPNAFTPGDDGLNDKFQVFLPPTGVDYSTFNLVIYDRWGGLVYKTSDVNVFWNGARNNSGEILPQGIYVWKITFKDEQKKHYEKVGHVTLMQK